MTKLLHYTLNTADTLDCSQKQYQPGTLKLLQPIAQRATLEGQSEGPLPHPLERYSVKTTVVPGFALFDIYEQGIILNSNAVAWSTEGQEEGWPLFEQYYLKLMGQFGTIQISRAPQMPASLPWLATLILPSPGAVVSWLADFEQCHALALIQCSKPKRDHKPPKGFGK